MDKPPKKIFKQKFNTKLNNKILQNYQEHAKLFPSLISSLEDYDTQGFYKSIYKENKGNFDAITQALTPSSETDHVGTDRFKKPNHPTFSKESKYYIPLLRNAGSWKDNYFNASNRNIKNMNEAYGSPMEYMKYAEDYNSNNIPDIGLKYKGKMLIEPEQKLKDGGKVKPPKKKYVSKTQGTRLDDGTYVTPIAEVKGYKTPANAIREGTGKFAKGLFSGANLATEVMGTPLALALEALSGRGDYKSALPNVDRSNKMFGLPYDKNNLPQNEQLSPSTALGITNPYMSVPIDLAADVLTGKLATSGKNIGAYFLKNKIPKQLTPVSQSNLLDVSAPVNNSSIFDPNFTNFSELVFTNNTPNKLSELPIDAMHTKHKKDLYSFFYNLNDDVKEKINTTFNNYYDELKSISNTSERQKFAAYLTTRDKKLKNNSIFNTDDIKEKSVSELTQEEFRQLKEKIGVNDPANLLKTNLENNPTQKIKKFIPLAKALEEAKYTPDELLAGRRYTRGFDEKLNLVNRLRGGSNDYFWRTKEKLLSIPKLVKKAIFEDANILQNAILKQKFAEDTQLFRNIQGKVHVIDEAGNKATRSSVYNMNAGDIIEEKGFMSTSTDPRSFGPTGKMSITAPGKKQSFYQPNQNLNSSEYINEHEAILPKGIKLQYTGNKDAKGNPIMSIINPYMITGIIATGGLLGNQMLQEKPKSKYGSKILKYKL